MIYDLNPETWRGLKSECGQGANYSRAETFWYISL